MESVFRVSRKIVPRAWARYAFVTAAALQALPAAAQVAKLNQTMETVQNILVGVSVTIVTIAVMWAGYKMLFQHSKLSDVAYILIGGIFIGGAPAIASMVVN